jgi:hypothetical protein
MAHISLVVTNVEVLGHDHGHWCNRCLLSTGVRAHVAMTIGTHTRMSKALWCTECGSRDIEVDPDAHHC